MIEFGLTQIKIVYLIITCNDDLNRFFNYLDLYNKMYHLIVVLWSQSASQKSASNWIELFKLNKHLHN